MYLIFRLDDNNIKITEINTSNSFNYVKNITFDEKIVYMNKYFIVLNNSKNRIKII